MVFSDLLGVVVNRVKINRLVICVAGAIFLASSLNISASDSAQAGGLPCPGAAEFGEPSYFEGGKKHAIGWRFRSANFDLSTFATPLPPKYRYHKDRSGRYLYSYYQPKIVRSPQGNAIYEPTINQRHYVCMDYEIHYRLLDVTDKKRQHKMKLSKKALSEINAYINRAVNQNQTFRMEYTAVQKGKMSP